MKIYTRTGDDGTTGLIGSGRVAKSSARVEAYGTVDELNAALGVARALDRDGWLAAEIEEIQRRLFDVGAELATPAAAALERMPRVSEADVARLEGWIDRFDGELPELRRFILPGGTELSARLHLARTVCRRAERRVVSLHREDPIEPRLVRYLNRLADLLFVLARWCNHRAGVADSEWKGGEEAR